jgi:putative Ca2+/H+ antiporter (TMEM165/GDT1 family)
MVEWGVVLSTFALVFVAELGDKTQLAVVTQVCRFRRPWAVFLGASVALVGVTALGAAGGRALTFLIPPEVLRVAAATGFLAMGGLVWWRGSRASAQDNGAFAFGPSCSSEADEAPRSGHDWRAFGSTLSLLFIAEMGDKTQLAVLGLSGKQAMPWSVFAGGAAALVAVTALGVLGGAQLCRVIPARTLLRLSAAAFVVMGGLMAAGVL